MFYLFTDNFQCLTRMHFSRMHTARTLPYGGGGLGAGGNKEEFLSAKEDNNRAYSLNCYITFDIS